MEGKDPAIGSSEALGKKGRAGALCPGRIKDAKNHRDDMTITSKLGSLACLPGVLSNLPVSRGCETCGPAGQWWLKMPSSIFKGRSVWNRDPAPSCAREEPRATTDDFPDPVACTLLCINTQLLKRSRCGS